MTVSWRPLSTDMVEELAELVNTLAKADGTDEYFEAEDLREELEAVGFDPVRDSVGAWQDGRLVGASKLWVSSNRGADGRGAVGIDGGVHPDFRGRGIGRQLMDRMESRARQLAAERHPGAEVWLRAFGGIPGASVRPLLEHRGFELARYFHEMERPLTGGLPAAADDLAQPYRPELSDAIRLAHNEAFAEHWGSSPRTEEQWQQMVDARSFRPACSFVSLAADGSVDAYVLSSSWMAEELYIGLVGTRLRARGRGLARACLAATLRAGAAAGMTKAVLSVDSENGSGAGRLYESMGFHRIRVTAAYRKLLPA